MKHPYCAACKRRMQRHGKTAAGVERYRCPSCKRTTIIHRKDTRKRHLHDHFVEWLPELFTYLDYPGCPNTTNLVEGWVNTAIAEGLGRHRGLTLSKKKTLVSVILSHLRRPQKKEKPTRIFP